MAHFIDQWQLIKKNGEDGADNTNESLSHLVVKLALLEDIMLSFVLSAPSSPFFFCSGLQVTKSHLYSFDDDEVAQSIVLWKEVKIYIIELGLKGYISSNWWR